MTDPQEIFFYGRRCLFFRARTFSWVRVIFPISISPSPWNKLLKRLTDRRRLSLLLLPNVTFSQKAPPLPSGGTYLTPRDHPPVPSLKRPCVLPCCWSLSRAVCHAVFSTPVLVPFPIGLISAFLHIVLRNYDGSSFTIMEFFFSFFSL